jgi:uncharacterized membrane protein YagU involved in acid resistance
MKKLLVGLQAGSLATFPMTLVMQLLHRWPVPEHDPLPPQQITQEVMLDSGNDTKSGQKHIFALTYVNHFAFGAFAGGLYATLGSRVKAPPVVKGISWGCIIWSLSYLGWLPATGILPNATRQPMRRNFIMIFSHLIWGIFTALLTESLLLESDDQS